jgi:transcriptional regulator with XRE-family HTH domain
MEEEALARRFGTLIRRLRFAKGYSQEGFAQVCKLDRAHMGVIERGEVHVTIRTALRLAKGLDITLSGLFLELERKYDNLEEDMESSEDSGA